MITQIIIFYACIVALWLIFAWLYFDYRLDLLRYRLFVLRDNLFLFAEEGSISFDSSAYKMTRIMLNGSLRFAHRLNLTDLIITCIVQSKYNPDAAAEYHKKFNDSYRDLNFEQKRFIAGIYDEMHKVMILHIAHISVLFFPFVFFAKCTLTFKLLVKHLRRHNMTKSTRKKFEPIDAVIYDLGLGGSCPAL